MRPEYVQLRRPPAMTEFRELYDLNGVTIMTNMDRVETIVFDRKAGPYAPWTAQVNLVSGEHFTLQDQSLNRLRFRLDNGERDHYAGPS